MTSPLSQVASVGRYTREKGRERTFLSFVLYPDHHCETDSARRRYPREGLGKPLGGAEPHLTQGAAATLS